jgi:hypothetical protein
MFYKYGLASHSLYIVDTHGETILYIAVAFLLIILSILPYLYNI